MTPVVNLPSVGAPVAEQLEQLVQREVARVFAQHHKGATIMVFSGEMDRVFTALAIANGSAAMGGESVVYFAFWGASALRTGAAGLRKPAIDRLLARVMPGGIDALPMSRMHFGGAGAWFFRWWMKRNRVQKVSEMLADARELGVRLMVCEMSMQLMGLRREDLIDGLEYGGVATFVREANRSGTVLFV